MATNARDGGFDSEHASESKPDEQDLQPTVAEPLPSTNDPSRLSDSRRAADDVAKRDSAATAGARPRSPTKLLRDGESVGPYRILECLGEGGMGVVYLADQEQPVRRRVALKLLKAKATDLKSNVRFVAEQQALARLAHPHVAQLFESGVTEDGFPFFAMEYVPGVGITEYCESKRLTMDDRLELVIAVCRGVEHAHQRGVLHRDLKPSNVLVMEVDGAPIPKVIDFGVAKGLDQPLGDVTGVTQDRVAGTLAYMSPEVVLAAKGELDLDTRADVYALGILLHELIVGGRPFSGDDQSAVQTLLRIAEDESPLISEHFDRLESVAQASVVGRRHTTIGRFRRRLKTDLDWIVMRAVARIRDERYASPGELAADIERHLEHRPIVASPPTWRLRLRKFGRRHRAAVVAGSLLAVALLLGMVGTSVGLLRARSAESKAAREALLATQEAAAAQQAQRETEEVLDFVVGLFEASAPGSTRAELTPIGEILDRGSESIENELSDQPEIRSRLQQTIGEIYLELGNYERAEQLLLGAKSSLESLSLGPSLAMVAVLESLGRVYELQGRFEESEEVLRQSLSLHRDQLGSSDLAIARSHRSLANALEKQGRFDESIAHSRLALSSFRAAHGSEHSDVGRALAGLAGDLRHQGLRDEASELYLQALQIFEKTEGEDHFLVAMVLGNLGLVYLDAGENGKAEPVLRRAREVFDTALGSDHPFTLMAHTNLGLVLREMRRFGEAQDVLDAMTDRGIEVLGDSHPEMARHRMVLGTLYLMIGQLDAAESYLVKSLETRESAMAADNPEIGYSLSDLGALRTEQRRFAEARTLLNRALSLWQSRGEADSVAAAEVLSKIGRLEWSQGHYQAAKSRYLEALTIRNREMAPDTVKVAEALVGLARTYRDLGQRVPAVTSFQKALDILRADLPADCEELQTVEQEYRQLVDAPADEPDD